VSGVIFLVKDNNELVELHEEPYEIEDHLQGLIAQYPALLSGEQAKTSAPRRWLLIGREVGVPDNESESNRWALDHLFIDQDGIPTLVEVKRSEDTRIRREVVGQMLDYAANAVVYWPIEKIQSQFERTCHAEELDPDDTLEEFLDDKSPEEFWQQVKTNLLAGRIRLMFVADEIPGELKRVVEFLNGQMDPAEVLALEVPRYSGGGLQTLVPRVVGQTAEAQGRKAAGTRPRRQWNEESIIEELKQHHGAEIIEVAEKVISWSKEHCSRITFGSGKNWGSTIPYLCCGDIWYNPFALWTDGTIEIKFTQLKLRPPFKSLESRQKLAGHLNEIEGVNIGDDKVDKRPSFKLSLLVDPNSLNLFFKAMEWTVGEIHRHWEAEGNGSAQD